MRSCSTKVRDKECVWKALQSVAKLTPYIRSNAKDVRGYEELPQWVPGNREETAIPEAPLVQPVNGPLAKQAVMPSRHTFRNLLITNWRISAKH